MPIRNRCIRFQLKKSQLMQFGMDGRQSLANGESEFFIGGGQPGFTDGVQSAKVSF